MSPLRFLGTLLAVAVWPLILPADPACAETQEKPQSHPTVPKLSAEPKPPPPAAPPAAPSDKSDAVSEKDPVKKPPGSQEKAPPQTTIPRLSTEPKPSASVPPDKIDAVPEKDAVKKPLGSLILTIKLALLSDARLFHYDVEVEEDQQTVTLGGRVSHEDALAAAMDVARSVPGVKTVLNKIQVDKTLASALMRKQDEMITALVKERFAKSATLKAANFEVKTEEGIVSLSGSVRFQVIALEAAETARHVPGVRAVNTQLVRLEGEG